MTNSAVLEQLNAGRITPDNSVMLFIDHHSALAGGVQTIDPRAVRNNTLALAKIAKIFHIPCVLTGEPPHNVFGNIWQELKDITGVEVVHRSLIDSMQHPDVLAAIERTGRKKIVMCGLTTEVCLVFPTQSALAQGYDVYAVLDASGTWNPLVQQAAMTRLEKAGATLVTWLVVAAELQRDWALPTASAVMAVYQEHHEAFGQLLANAAHAQGQSDA